MALLSPLLEKLVLSGQAVLKTNVIGHSGHSVLEVSKNSLIIIVEFDYQNFVDYEDPDDLSNVVERSVHQLQFRSPKSSNHFIIREPLNTLGVTMPSQINNVNGTYRKETFLIHEGNVEISIVLVPSPAGGANLLGTAPSELGAQQPPLGYGTGATAILSTIGYIDGVFANEYVPLTRKFTPFTFGVFFNTSQFLAPVNPFTALEPTFTGSNVGARSYPIVNVTYVEILRSLADKIFSTS